MTNIRTQQAQLVLIDSGLHQKIDEQNIYEIQLHSGEKKKNEIITSTEDESTLVKWVNNLDQNELTQLAKPPCSSR